MQYVIFPFLAATRVMGTYVIGTTVIGTTVIGTWVLTIIVIHSSLSQICCLCKFAKVKAIYGQMCEVYLAQS